MYMYVISTVSIFTHAALCSIHAIATHEESLCIYTCTCTCSVFIQNNYYYSDSQLCQ